MAVRPLAGCRVAASGTFPAGNTHGAIQKKVQDLGGKFQRSLTSDTTHLMTTTADYEKKSTKVTDAKAKGVHIVSLDWLLDSETKGARQREARYSFTANSKRPAPATVDSDDDDPDDPQPKKQKVANGAATKPKKEPKVDGQKAKSKDIVIPVDERFPEVDWKVYVDPVEGVIYDAALNQTSSAQNNNKFYKAQVGLVALAQLLGVPRLLASKC
jgi:poly [ADP-ribose] polymerase 2/3/4